MRNNMSYVKVADYIDKRGECPDCDVDQEKFRGAPMNHCITCPNISQELKEVREKIVNRQKLTYHEQEILERNWKPLKLRTPSPVKEIQTIQESPFIQEEVNMGKLQTNLERFK